MARYGFYMDMVACAGCQACTVACQNLNGLDPRNAFTRVHRYEAGAFPDLQAAFVARQCMHCDDPPCTEVCPTGASYKMAEGPVRIDGDKCIGCRYCITACPYDAREVDVNTGKVIKCTECYERSAAGLPPGCVQTCIAGARLAGDLDDPASAISQAVQQPGVVQVKGTSVYLKLPAHVARSAFPADFRAPAHVYPWQSILQPLGQLILGGTGLALVASFAAQTLSAAREGGKDHGEDNG